MNKQQIIGLTFLLIGIVILIGFGMYKFVIAFAVNQSISLIIRIATFIIIIGVSILLLTLVKERIKEVKR